MSITVHTTDYIDSDIVDGEFTDDGETSTDVHTFDASDGDTLDEWRARIMRALPYLDWEERSNGEWRGYGSEEFYRAGFGRPEFVNREVFVISTIDPAAAR